MRLWDNKYIKALGISIFSGLLVFAGMHYSGLFARLTPAVPSAEQAQSAQQQQQQAQGQKQGTQQQGQQQGQQAGGLAAARERAAGAALGSDQTRFRGQYTRKELSKEALEALEQDQASAEEKEEGNIYTQSEAHLQLEEVKEKMSHFLLYAEGTKLKEGETPIEKTPNEMVAPYLNIVAAAINKEVQFKNTHYVFYHGMTTEWRVPQDLHKQLYAYFNPLAPVKDFVFVRFSDMPFIKAQDYLTEHLERFAGVDDNKDKTILPVNLALFGNVGFPGECTWNYFIMNKSHAWPVAENYQPILDSFDLSYDLELLAKEAGELVDLIANATPEQTILQIFIPKEKVDDIGFLSWIIGFPAHPKSMELVEKFLGDKPMVGKNTASAVNKLMKKYKKEGEDNSVYQELIEAAENGDFGIDSFLKVYCNTPWKLKNPNDTQARLMITSDGLLNPDSGIKMFYHFLTPKDIQEKYQQKLDVLVKKILNKNKR